jgi:hypothetical protein
MTKYCVGWCLAAAGLWPLVAGAQVYDKNGTACVEQVCLGDGLDTLRTLRWEPLGDLAPPAGMPAAPGQLPRATQPQFQVDEGALDRVSPYLHAESFDGDALAALEQVRAACGKHELRGNFVAADGSPTRVGIALRPGDTPSVQRWQVVSITQSVPSAVTDEQRAALRDTLHERYKNFNVTKVHNPQPGVNTFFITSTPDQFTYNLLLYRGLKEEAQLRRHPYCGGTGEPEAADTKSPPSTASAHVVRAKSGKTGSAAGRTAKSKAAKAPPARAKATRAATPAKAKVASKAAPVKKAAPPKAKQRR